VHLSKGKNILTVHIVTDGTMNLAYFDFKQVPGSNDRRRDRMTDTHVLSETLRFA
jgi:hypothetical protein